MKCKYGCGQEGKHEVKSGGWCCESSHHKCPESRRKNSIRAKEKNYFSKGGDQVKKECRFCGKVLSSGNLIRHQNSCYLNPENLRLCCVCGKPIKSYRHNKTCSCACANSFFRQGKGNGQWRDNSYRSTCFLYHSKKCIICGENNIVSVHHLDENRENNNPDNLIPLCPTHHTYMHSKFKSIILSQIESYVKEEHGK